MASLMRSIFALRQFLSGHFWRGRGQSVFSAFERHRKSFVGFTWYIWNDSDGMAIDDAGEVIAAADSGEHKLNSKSYSAASSQRGEQRKHNQFRPVGA